MAAMVMGVDAFDVRDSVIETSDLLGGSFG
jgi:hypothetical protein